MGKYIVRFLQEFHTTIEAKNFRDAYDKVNNGNVSIEGVRAEGRVYESEHIVSAHCAVCGRPLFSSINGSDSQIDVDEELAKQLDPFVEFLPLSPGIDVVCKECAVLPWKKEKNNA